MHDRPQRPTLTDRDEPAPATGRAGLREARLKAALKANMARRKSQAKARQAPENTKD
ncbi:MAG: hypothetical protein V4516_01595 [Pseudomonadota bacterium]